MSIYKRRLSDLRDEMKKHHIDAFIIPNADQWQSEHPDPCDARLEFVCGLKASAGFCVVTHDKAAVLIDSRYTISAQQQIDQDAFQIGFYTETPPILWAIDAIEGDGVIGYDPWLHTKAQAKSMQKMCNDLGVVLESVRDNPVDTIWDDRPTRNLHPAMALDISYSGQSVEEKLNALCNILLDDDVDSLIITAPDSIAWLLNMRVPDNSQSPTIPGYAIFQTHEKKLTVFTDFNCSEFNGAETDQFEVDFLELDDFPSAISRFEQKEQVIQIDPSAPDWFTEHLNSPANEEVESADPCTLLKSCKNEVEQHGIRNVHKRDAVAMKTAIHRIYKTVENGQTLTEIDINDILLEERKKCPLFQGVSFDTIAGWNENGAKIHGMPGDTQITGDGLLLIDSGGQYLDGTTDITRTIGIGTPADEMKQAFTIVLKAHIALATAIFPTGTTGTQLDALVRNVMWQHGMDFGHGTGHGVGHFLNVHEGPCNISPRSVEPLLPGMLLSNEPGYYKEGSFGIRHENLMVVQKYRDKNHPDNHTGKDLLHFETVTFVPFDEDCVLRDMMTRAEQEWFDAYQKTSR